ncbi:S8 family serine peptidase [bacterium]|nr:S8 family serine peptidase [bacterium]
MKRILVNVAMLLLLSSTGAVFAGGMDSEAVQSGSFVGFAEDRIVVRYAVDPAGFTPLLTADNTLSLGVVSLDDIASQYGVREIEPLFPGARPTVLKGKSFDLSRYQIMTFDPKSSLDDIVAAYEKDPNVLSVERIGIMQVLATPNDPSYSSQWHLNQASDHDIDAPEAWDSETGSNGKVVAILDTGVRYFHKDLGGANASYTNPAAARGNMWINWAEKNGQSGVDDDGNGFIDDWIGWDFVNGTSSCWSGEDCTTQDNDPRDFHGHGTHCAGIVSAANNNGLGVSGVAGGWAGGSQQETYDGVTIMPLRIGWKASNGNGYVDMSFAAQAFYYAANNGADIASCSWGSSNWGGIAAAVDYFIASGGMVFKAAGNSNNEIADYLCGRTDVISVAATEQSDNKASFSSYGTWVDISAPGQSIYSTHHQYNNPSNDAYVSMSGTSMATPMAAGTAALLWSHFPTWNASQVQTQLFASADDIDAYLSPAYIGKMGAGRINAYHALDAGEPQVLFMFPEQNEIGVAPEGAISVLFDMNIDPSTVTSSSFTVFDPARGYLPGSLSANGAMIQFDPDDSLRTGAQITVAMSQDIESSYGVPLTGGYEWTFTVAGCSDGLFDTSLEYSTYEFPTDVAVADLNGDDALDVITATSVNDRLTVLLNNGSGAYPTPVHINVGANRAPDGIATADFDGDGTVDVALSCWESNSLILLTNDGNGNLTIASETSPSSCMHGGCWPADLDLDGDIDLVVGLGSCDQIGLLYNNGSGSFSGLQTLTVGDNPFDPHAVDFNNDGYPDLVVVNAYGNTMSVFLNDGTGSFGSADTYVTADRPISVAPADYDGDGDVDLAVVALFDEVFSLYTNNGSGVFSSPSTQSVYDQPNAVRAADLDNDDDMDVIIVHGPSERMTVLWNNGSGSLAGGLLGGYHEAARSLTVGDVDGDLSIDIIAANCPYSSPGTISIMKGHGLPKAPVLYSPLNGKTLTAPVAPHLNCNDVAGAIFYHFQIDDDPNFGSPIQSSFFLSVSDWYVSQQLGAGTYYWRARAANSCGFGPYAEPWVINVVSPPPPSCPVLFAGTPDGFVQENPLLTACEASGYRESVTDHYFLTQPLEAVDGEVVLQLRELEDEITYLESFELIAVDHEAGTGVVCDKDNNVLAYDRTLAPLSAFDQDGVDRLAEVVSADGQVASFEGTGSLILTFASIEGPTAIAFGSTKKPPCIEDPPNELPKVTLPVVDAGVEVELMSSTGGWTSLRTTPTRTNPVEEAMVLDLSRSGSDVATVRLSWEEGFSTDVIAQYVASAAAPVTRIAPMQSNSLTQVAGKTTVANIGSGSAVVLKKGDVLEMRFAVPSETAGKERSYLVRAEGRYQPDYAVYSNLVPTGFQLYDAYPNPFNPTTTIQYDLPQNAHVRIDVFNVLGQHVSTLFDAEQTVGHYQVEWNGKSSSGESVASGVYLYRLTTPEFSDTKKMMLVK